MSKTSRKGETNFYSVGLSAEGAKNVYIYIHTYIYIHICIDTYIYIYIYV